MYWPNGASYNGQRVTNLALRTPARELETEMPDQLLCYIWRWCSPTAEDGAAWPLGAGRAQGTCLFGVQYSAPSEKLACELIWE